MTLKVIHQLQGFSSAIPLPFLQRFTRFQLKACSHIPLAIAWLLVCCTVCLKNFMDLCDVVIFSWSIPSSLNLFKWTSCTVAHDVLSSCSVPSSAHSCLLLWLLGCIDGYICMLWWTEMRCHVVKSCHRLTSVAFWLCLFSVTCSISATDMVNIYELAVLVEFWFERMVRICCCNGQLHCSGTLLLCTYLLSYCMLYYCHLVVVVQQIEMKFVHWFQFWCTVLVVANNLQPFLLLEVCVMHMHVAWTVGHV